MSMGFTNMFSCIHVHLEEVNWSQSNDSILKKSVHENWLGILEYK